MKPALFAAGLVRIGIAVRQPPDEGTIDVYYDSIGHQADEDEWERFTRWVVDTDRFKTFFPKLPELRAALREFRGALPLEAEGAKAYERVLASGEYTAEGGTSWNYRAVKDRCGVAAAEAFLVAGGHNAFASTWDEAKRRERFIAAYSEAVREDASAALLPAGDPVKLLPAPSPPSREEADKILREIAGDAKPTVKPKHRLIEASDERMAQLRAQAAELLGDQQ